MSIKRLINTVLLFLSFLCFHNSVVGQKVGKPIKGVEKTNLNITPIGFIDDYEFYSYGFLNARQKLYYRVYSYKDGRKKGKQKMTVDLNNKTYTPYHFFIYQKRFFAAFIAENQNRLETGLYFQEYNTNLEEIGKPQFIVKIPNAQDELSLQRNYSHFKGDAFLNQNLSIQVNEATKDVLVLHTNTVEQGKEKKAYANIIRIDKNLAVISHHKYTASSPSTAIKLEVIGSYYNRDLLAYVSTGTYENDKKTNSFFIQANSILFIPGNGNELEEITIHEQTGYIKSVVASETSNNKGNYAFAFHTTNDHAELGTITFFRFNPAKSELSETYLSLAPQPFNFMDRTLLGDFRIKNLFLLDEGNFIADLYGGKQGNLLLRINGNAEILWHKKVRPKVSGSKYVIGAYTTMVGTNLQMIFNCHPQLLASKSEESNRPYRVGFQSIPVVATIELEEGETKYEMLKMEDLERVYPICFTISIEKSPGTYLLRAINGRKMKTFPVTFDR